jgi:hypothetical protein
MHRRQSNLKKDKVTLLDSDEQATVVDELTQEATSQSRTYRFYFSILYCGIAMLMTAGFFHFMFRPWQSALEKRFQFKVPAICMAIHYIISALVCLNGKQYANHIYLPSLHIKYK